VAQAEQPMFKVFHPTGSVLAVWAFTLAFQAPGPSTPLKSVTVNGARLAVVDAGDGVPVVLVHGGLQDYRLWTRTLRRSPRAIGRSPTAGGICAMFAAERAGRRGRVLAYRSVGEPGRIPGCCARLPREAVTRRSRSGSGLELETADRSS
jgi:hypothetical protein